MLLFAHSGSGPHALLPALNWAPADVEIVGVTLPGRERRHREPYLELLASPTTVVNQIADSLRSLPPLPTVFVGHSLGAQIAMAVATREPVSCHGLVLSACPPSTPRQEGWTLTEEEVLDIVARAAGTPSEIIDHPLLRNHLLSILRADLQLGRRLAVRPVTLPVTPLVIGGADDQLVPPDDLARLAEQCGVRGGPHFLPGGHFYLLDERNHSSFKLVVGGLLESVIRGTDDLRPARNPVDGQRRP